MTNSDFIIKNNVLEKYFGENKEVVIPDGVKEIGEFAFENNQTIVDVTIPDSAKTIKCFAFSNCKNLVSVRLSNSLRLIGESAFEGCEKLEHIAIPDGVEKIGKCAFTSCKKLADKNGFLIIGNVLYNYFGQESDVDIPKHVTEIGRFVFAGHGDKMKNLVHVTIPERVTKIGPYAFDFCSNLKSISMTDSVTSFGEDAFVGCDNLTICAPVGSPAERYAKRNQISFKKI